MKKKIMEALGVIIYLSSALFFLLIVVLVICLTDYKELTNIKAIFEYILTVFVPLYLGLSFIGIIFHETCPEKKYFFFRHLNKWNKILGDFLFKNKRL